MLSLKVTKKIFTLIKKWYLCVMGQIQSFTNSDRTDSLLKFGDTYKTSEKKTDNRVESLD